ncbi:hypothetical protein GGTG_09206 [Gaeumannomyces tritici R3-111a-1]|uniref:Clr5 domain-containing protein n=1 Tax=Gaeumannomyces tritici (strain R3-111a-1) TaxID=644352 RepID=J3P6R4_GAET3|nr:hypothetical protein GGTG_09206 [Gaeumannomyces tritici R3-111a-1]EJT72340.1 hypothetical protein GGTG_09206 [Gaeumannomyces tritici R3-111a-1]
MASTPAAEPNGPAFSRRAWEERRDEIVRLYQDEDCDFKALVEIMKTNGFSATRREYMKKFKQWDIRKNVKADEYAAIVRVQARRQAEGKRTAFRVRKRPVSQANISRYIRKSKKKGSPKPSVDGEAIVEAHTPPFIEYDTPPASPSSPTLSGGQGYADSITLTECGKPGSQSPTPDAITQGSTQLSAGIEFAASWKSGQWALGAVEDLSDSDPPSPAMLVRSSHHQDSIIGGHSPRAFLIRRSPARAAQVMPGLTRHFMRQAHSPPRAVAMPDTLRYADGVLRSIRDYVYGLRTAALCSCDEDAEGNALMPKTGAGAIHPRHCWLAEANPKAGRDCSANLVNGFALMEAARYAEGRALLQAALAQYDECVRHCPYQAKFLSTFLSIHARHAPLHRAQAVVFDYVRRVLRRRLGALWPDHPLVRIVDILFLATKSHAASVVRDPAIMLFVDSVYGRNSEKETVPGIDDKTVLMSPVRRWEWTFFSLRANFERVAGAAAVETDETSPPLRSLRRRLTELHSGIEAEQNPLFDCLLKLLVFVAHKGPVDMHLEPLYAHLIQYPGSMDKILSCAKDLVAGLWGDWADKRTRCLYLRTLVIALWRFEQAYTGLANGEAAAVLRLWRLPIEAWLADHENNVEADGRQLPAELRPLMDQPKGNWT